MKTIRAISPIAAGLSALVVLAGCGSSGNETTTAANGKQKAAGQVHQSTVAQGKAKSSTGKASDTKAKTNGKTKTTGIPANAPSYVGSFSSKLSPSDVSSIDAPVAKAGKWVLILGNSSYNLSSPGGLIGGTLVVKGKRMTFSPMPTPKLTKAQKKQLKKTKTKAPVTPCAHQRGVYTYSLSGKKLTFHAVSDSCAARRVPLNQPWTKG